MQYVVIKTGGKQYKLSEGDEVELEKLPYDNNQEVIFDEVLLFVSDNDIKIGKPFIPGITVKAKVLEQKKGEKIRVAKFRAKSRYRRVMGHRQLLTKVRIEKIATVEKPSKPEKTSTIKTAKKTSS